MIFPKLFSSKTTRMTSLKLPKSQSTVSVSIVNTTAWARKIPCRNLFYPRYKGLETFDLCSYAFLVTHNNGASKRQLLFDLGIRRDWTNLVPDMVQKFENWGADIQVQKDVSEILIEHDVDLNGIEAIIWR